MLSCCFKDNLLVHFAPKLLYLVSVFLTLALLIRHYAQIPSIPLRNYLLWPEHTYELPAHKSS